MKATYERKEYLQFANERIYPGDEVLIYFASGTFVSGIVRYVKTNSIVITSLCTINLEEISQLLKKVDGRWRFIKEEKE